MQKNLKRTTALLLVVMTILSCRHGHDKTVSNRYRPKIKQGHGTTVSKDSIVAPKIKLEAENNPEDIRAGKPVVTLAPANVVSAGEPKKIITGEGVVCVPGEKGFMAPVILPAIDSSYPVGSPETTIAKDASSRDQNPQDFTSFSQLQGLKQTSISALLEDRSGNLWIGLTGGGLTKYDGRNFTFFGASQGLDAGVRCLLEDRLGNLWFGTSTGGAVKYDGRSFTSYGLKEGLSNERVFCLAEDNAGNIWFGTNGNGAIKYDGKAFTHFTDKQGLVDSFVMTIVKDRSGALWFAGSDGISKFDGKSFTNYEGSDSLQGVVSTLQDRNGNVWFGTAGRGVIKYDGKIFSRYTRAEGLSGDDIRGILEDRAGNIWFSTGDNGITKFDGKQFTKLTEAEGLPSTGTICGLQDKYGNLWFGTTRGGLCKYQGQSFTHFTDKEGLSMGDGVYRIFNDHSGTLWLGTAARGLLKYDGRTFTNYTAREGLADNVIAMAKDSTGNYWFGTTKGFVKFDGKTFTHYTDKDGKFNSFVFSIIVDKKGTVWIGTAGGGLTKFDGKYFTKYNLEQGMADNFIRCMREDSKGNIWIGTNSGVMKFDGRTFTNFSAADGLGDDEVLSICEDHSGKLWFGTYGGLTMYDGKTFTNFTRQEGLANDNVKSVLADRNGNIWIATALGISKLTNKKLDNFLDEVSNGGVDKEDVFFKNYGYEDGFLGIGVISNSLCEDDNGNIWVGANDRLTVCHPAGEEAPDTASIQTALTSIQLFGEEIPWVNLQSPHQQSKDSSFFLSNGIRIAKFEFDSLARWNGLPNDLTLNYDNNFVSFKFVGISMNQPKNIRYQYRLEGLDDHWSPLNATAEASYGNLPPGQYSFKVRAMNSEGYWGKEFLYKFIIRPPWWKTGWAYALYLSIFCFALWAFIRWRLNQLKKEKAALVEKIEIQQALMNERLRISRELHDEVGATLSGIAMYSHLAKDQLKNSSHETIENSLNVMQKSSSEMVNKLNDIVWLVNPEQDRLEKLIQRLEEYASNMGAIKNMKVKIHVPGDIREHNLSMETRRNIYLFCKEAINNAVKYSDGTVLELTVAENNGTIEFSIKDDGNGFDPATVRKGNGLDNMQKRANEMAGSLTLVSKHGAGTLLSLQIKVV